MDEQTVTKFRLQRQVHNDFVRLYFTRTALTDVIEPGLRGATFEYANPVLEAIMGIPGVEAATVYPYHVVVQRARAFEWDELEAPILCLLTSLHIPLPSPEFLDSDSEDLPK